MKKGKLDSVMTMSRLRSLHFLMGLVFIYYLLMITQFPVLFRFLDTQHHRNPTRFLKETPKQHNPRNPTSKLVSNLGFRERKPQNSTIYRAATKAWIQGTHLWDQLIKVPVKSPSPTSKSAAPACPDVVSVVGSELKRGLGFVGLPCGLTVGSHVTVMGKARRAHLENETRISVVKGVMMNVSQFMLELRRERVIGKSEEPASLLHFNPRIKGDWSGRPVIEMNNCYRGQWGSAVRCEGWRSSQFEETVDGLVKCEEWIRNNDTDVEDSNGGMWLNKLMGHQRKKAEMDRPFPFSEEKFFVLTIAAGLEGYHISVDGRHITSFAYRTGSDLEEGMLLYIYGDVDVHSVFAANLPSSHPGFAPERHLEMSSKWKARPLPSEPIILFIGIISSGDHFAERMAVRKSWMQHYLINSLAVVARFFVALHEKVGINAELKKEAEFFGDIIIVPYLDNYDLVVLKTLAICEYGVNMLSAKYIMKCDDDTFVRVDAVIEEARRGTSDKSLYVGKMNYYHKPLRNGKWAVTYEEWPGKVYPPYADGAGYIISSNIARFIVSEFEKSKLRLFKMEDVSMGMWVEQFNSSKPVEYLHSAHFHQSGCIHGYYTAHYQSPRQLICLWEILQSEGIPRCCNLG